MAEAKLPEIWLQVRPVNSVGSKTLTDGNDSAALGAVCGGATVAASHLITPFFSLAEAFAYR